MFTSGEEQILFHSEHASENVTEAFKTTSWNLNPDSINGSLSAAEFPDSPPVSTIYTDVGVIPEHEKNELEQLMSNLEREVKQLRNEQCVFDKKRREALSKILDIKGSIRVFCRVRPFLLAEGRITSEPVSAASERIRVKMGGAKKDFEFDKVFPQEANQESVFIEVEPILRSAMDGHNVCVLAYGQTGTGKTFTMNGTNEQPGIIPRALEELFRRASLENSSSFTFSMSMLEVYMGSLRDLLAPRPCTKAYEPVIRCNLNIQTDPKGLVEIEGLSEVQISDSAKARWWYNKGRRARSTSWTHVNEASSRSHCLTRITIFRRGHGLEGKREISKLWMVDLGGSERLLKTGAVGLTLNEGRAINLSLSALADVIAALRRKRSHVPYRNSKLTQILKDSLGNGSKVLMLVHISPYEEDVCETMCSLNFAKRARATESNKEIPEELRKQKEKKILELEEEMREAEKEHQKLRDQIQKAELKLEEQKKVFSTTYKLLENDDSAPISPKNNAKEVTETPKASKKYIKSTISNSMPRFMTSTVASRQRQSASEREIVGRSRSLRSAITRGSLQFSGSQSLNCSDLRLKAVIQNSTGKSRLGETTESPKCNGLESKTTNPGTRMFTSSDPNVVVTLRRHRRRMSDLN
ncbi:kinesin-like protein KIN-14U [Neltuma alba]|uniref:kinesin-like protein KIN-14U n=1 Tax=Neltuma alba TaxID=207710 RepID=UPI0010A2AF88|nr:kinesin-like protein KIN-14U [Prosopis alba]XP_028770776.1 kinesin-like protein KIN-14U [Prosopis alba]XP_028770777.1 kinesin-like protein KIN-14U [Prosopis alba]XP_028770778.1 kinesin-like protein KIN-14U [Prosopis alba]